MRCREESWALKTEREGKEGGRRATAGLWVGGAQATRRAARRLRYLQYAAKGGRQASLVRMDVGVEKKQLVTHLHVLCQKEFIAAREWEFRVRRSEPYVRMGRRRPCAMRWLRKDQTPVPGEESLLTKEKLAWARETL